MNNKTSRIVLSGILVAIAIIIPMIMPVRIIVGPYTATLAAHVPIMLAIFISPGVAAAVALGSAVGFFFSAPFIVACRAATHIIFAMVMVGLFRYFAFEKPLNVALVGLVGGVVHAAAEVAVIVLLGTGIENLAVFLYWTFFGTLLHHLVDLAIAYVIYGLLKKAGVWKV